MSDRFAVRATPLEGVSLVIRRPTTDGRGSFERLYSTDDLADVLGSRSVVQVNRTHTLKRGTVRGMHYQLPPHAELKVVICLRGSVFDVAVDLRKGSPTFLAWHAEVLDASGSGMLVMPEGVAHGFQALDDNCEMLYFHTAAHEPASERRVHPRDPLLAINWPESITELSQQDASSAMLSADFDGIAL